MKNHLKTFLCGASLPFTLISLYLVVQLSFGGAVFQEFNSLSFTEFARSLLSSLATAFFEEFIFRVLLLTALLRSFKLDWLSIILCSFIFALPHAGNSHITEVALVSHFFGGLMYSYAYLKTQRICLPFGLHFGWNYTQIVWGMPMSGTSYPGYFELTFNSSELLSGGLYGFEGSPLSIVIRILIIIVLYFFFKLIDSGESNSSNSWITDHGKVRTS